VCGRMEWCVCRGGVGGGWVVGEGGWEGGGVLLEYKALRNRHVCYCVSASVLINCGRNVVTWSW